MRVEPIGGLAPQRLANHDVSRRRAAVVSPRLRVRAVVGQEIAHAVEQRATRGTEIRTWRTPLGPLGTVSKQIMLSMAGQRGSDRAGGQARLAVLPGFTAWRPTPALSRHRKDTSRALAADACVRSSHSLRRRKSPVRYFIKLAKGLPTKKRRSTGSPARPTSSIAEPARRAVFPRNSVGPATSGCPISLLPGLIHATAAGVYKNLCPWRVFNFPSKRREIRLGAGAGLDRVGFAVALGEPVEPFGANDADQSSSDSFLPDRGRRSIVSRVL